MDENFPRFEPHPEAKGEVEQPMSKSDVEYEKMVYDSKCRALGVLCTLQSSGKGDSKTVKYIEILASQIAKL